MNTDLTYASKEDFQTDAQIAAAKQNGEVALKLIILDGVHPGRKKHLLSPLFHPTHILFLYSTLVLVWSPI